MADDKYAKSKCFVFSKDGYEEITYSELCLRKDTDIRYQEKKFVPLHEMLMEVTPEQYADFYRTKNRQRYIFSSLAFTSSVSIKSPLEFLFGEIFENSRTSFLFLILFNNICRTSISIHFIKTALFRCNNF